jgi:serine/threonine protein kinase
MKNPNSVQGPRQEEGMPPIEPAERDAIFSMLRSMLVFKPESRATAKQILDSEWMVKWALPEFEKCRLAGQRNG